jgi:hypothetical protein
MRRERWYRLAVLARLERIERAVTQPEPEPATVQVSACLHPEEARVELSGMGHRQFICKLCGFEYKE